MIKKAILLGRSLIIYFKYKLKYRKYLSLSLLNSIKGNLSIDIQKDSFILIGEFLMISGPLYLKSIENGILKIGNRVYFNHNCSITASKKITIGNNCMFANNVVVVDHNHEIKDGVISSNLISKEVIIDDNVWCGANVTILPGVHIGQGSIIGAGAVVNTDIPDHALAVGIPAKVIKRIN